MIFLRDEPTSRKAAIVLGFAVVSYLGGLLDQLNNGYQIWLAQDGFSNSVKMPATNFSPLYCIANAFSSSGIKVTLIVAVAAAALFLYIKLHSKFGNGEYDDRNFKRAKEGTYGTAAWMSDKEMKKGDSHGGHWHHTGRKGWTSHLPPTQY